jgi:hypothetical protein
MKEFYPSITKKLYKQAIEFAKRFTQVDQHDIEILLNARQQIITWGSEAWAKKNMLFDDSMGSYDGAECCELIGLLLLHHIKSAFPEEDFGLYRDDMLGVTEKKGHQASTLEKNIHSLFKSFDLKITSEINIKLTIFLMPSSTWTQAPPPLLENLSTRLSMWIAKVPIHQKF